MAELADAGILEVAWLSAPHPDGTQPRWDLLSGGEGLWLKEGLSGLHLPEFTHQWTEAARGEGRRWDGVTYSGRDVVAVLAVGDAEPDPAVPGGWRTGAAWRELEQQVWRSFSEEVPGTLLVRTESAGHQFLHCRLGAAPDPVYVVDPAQEGIAEYAVTLSAESAWWTGLEVRQEFVYNVATENYFGGDAGGGFATPKVLSPASDFATASISNPGDRKGYARVHAYGPGRIVYGLGSRTTALPVLGEGQELHIDTDPMVATVTDEAGVNAWTRLGRHDLSVPIPPGQHIPLNITFEDGRNGVSRIVVELSPTRRRAWS